MKFYKDIPYKIAHLEHYNLKRIMSFSVRYNYLIGGKGYGKTYSVRYFVFSDFVKHGKKFAWCRSTDAALQEIQNTDQFFGRSKAILSTLGVENYYIKGNKIYLNGEIAGYLFSLSTFYNNKGADYADVVNFVWDEFMREDGERYQRGVKEKLFKLMEAVGREEGARCFMLSNSTNKYDETLKEFNLNFSKGHGIYLYRDKNSLIHFIESSEEFKKRKSKSLSMEGMNERDRKIALGNEFIDYDEYFNINKAKYLYTVQIGDNEYISVYNTNDTIYIVSGSIQNPKLRTPINRYVNSKVLKLSPLDFKVLRNTYNNGKVVFKDGYCRGAFQETIL